MYNHLLDTFILVADEKSINKASDKLFISPVSVMKQIRKLESQIGVKLFERTNKGCILTEDGIKVYKGAKDIIRHSNKILHEIRTSECFVLKLGVSFFNNGKNFFEIWKKMENKYHDIKINIVSIEGNRLSLNNLTNGDVDMLIGLCDFYEKPKCEYIKIDKYKQMAVVPTMHKLASKKEIKMSDLENTKIYVPKRGIFPTFDELVNRVKANIESATFVEMQSDSNIAKIMNDSINNNYIFFATNSFENKHPGLVSIPLEFGKDVPCALFYNGKLLKEHPEVKTMLNLLKEASK